MKIFIEKAPGKPSISISSKKMGGNRMMCRTVLSLSLIVLLSSACQPVCPPGSVTYLPDPTMFPIYAPPADASPTPTPSLVEISGRMMEVDRLIQGPLCNDVWSGTVYVGCNVQVVEWVDTEYPMFLKNCDLTIEPETIVYVAAHNDAAYYNGCSCHVEGESK